MTFATTRSEDRHSDAHGVDEMKQAHMAHSNQAPHMASTPTKPASSPITIRGHHVAMILIRRFGKNELHCTNYITRTTLHELHYTNYITRTTLHELHYAQPPNARELRSSSTVVLWSSSTTEAGAPAPQSQCRGR